MTYKTISLKPTDYIHDKGLGLYIHKNPAAHDPKNIAPFFKDEDGIMKPVYFCKREPHGQLGFLGADGHTEWKVRWSE